LARPEYDALTAATDLLQQFVIAKIREARCAIRFLFLMMQRHGIIAAGVTASGDSRAREQIEAGLKQARCAKSFRRVGKNFRAALSTNSRCAAHDGRVGCALPIMYCADFWHTLRPQNGDQMAQLIFNVAGDGDSVTDFFAQQQLVALAKTMQGLSNSILSHAQLRSNLCS